MLPGLSARRDFFINSQNSSISTTRSTDNRMASASVFAPRAFLARLSARSSTNRIYASILVSLPFDLINRMRKVRPQVFGLEVFCGAVRHARGHTASAD